MFKIIDTLILNINAAITKQLSGPEKFPGLSRNRPLVKVGYSWVDFWDPRFDQNTVRDSGKVSGIRDLTTAGEARFAKIWAWMREWERKIFGLEMNFGMGDSRKKVRDQEPPFQTQCLDINSRCSHVGCSSSNVLHLVYDLMKQNPSGRLKQLDICSSGNYL